jgi:hypothetical protein
VDWPPVTPANQVAGTVYASTTAITAIDVAENYTTLDASLEAGDVVSADTLNGEFIVKSTTADRDRMLGVVSTAPGVLLGRKIETSRPLPRRKRNAQPIGCRGAEWEEKAPRRTHIRGR